MKTILGLIVTSIFLTACNPSSALSGSDFELFGEACNSLKSQEKRKQCQVALENLKGESKAAPDSKKTAKPQETRIPINFKDIPLGQAGAKAALTEICKQDKNNQPSTYDKRDRCEYQDKQNIIRLSYGNLGHSLAVIELGDGESLDSVEFKESKAAMLGLVEILQEKYGPPKKTTNSVENKMGTKFDQEIFVWVDTQGNRITVDSIYDKIDEGRVVIESAARVTARGIAEKVVKEVGKSNL
jgi:hypothetical protein